MIPLMPRFDNRRCIYSANILMILDYSVFGESLTSYGRYLGTYLFDDSMYMCYIYSSES
jgi:hypothetical protein